MQLSRTYLWTALVLGALCLPAPSLAAQSSVIGPNLGFTRDSAGAVLWPIIGVPGAASLAERLQFQAEIHDAVISPSQDYAIAVRNDDGEVVVLNFRASPQSFMAIAGAHPNPNMVGISPSGTSAALYNADTRSLQVVGKLLQEPAVVNEVDLSGIAGHATSVALSDDGKVALLNFVYDEVDGRSELWMASASGLSVIATESASDVAFFPNRHDAFVASDAMQTAFLVMDLDHTATRIPVYVSMANGLESFSKVSVSGNGREVLLADRSGKIVIVDMQTFRPRVVDCQCQLTGFYRMKQNSIFRLTDASGEAVTVLDDSSGEARVFIIPPESSERVTAP